MGIVHQVNLEFLAKAVFLGRDGQGAVAFPDTLVGTDSHTTMINGLGVVGWGVGGIEAEAVMLGQPLYMLMPEVVGMELTGQLTPGATATDLVLTVTEILRKQGVVGKFVEFYGPGVSSMSLADRATIANMAPEYGATMGFFPIDAETLNYLRRTGRTDQEVRAGRAVHEGTGPVPHRRRAGAEVHQDAHAGPGHGRAVPGGAEAAAGPRAADAGQVVVRGGLACAAESTRICAGRRSARPQGHGGGQRPHNRRSATAPW